MKATRWRLPDAPLRSSVILAGVLGVLGVAGLGVVGRSWLELGGRYPAHAIAVFSAMMTIAAGLAGAHHPFPRFGAGNQVTLIRAMLVALMASVLAEPVMPETAWWVVGATALVATLDGLDGWLARRTRMASVFGARFDMETDALLILVLSVLVSQYGKAGAWVIVCGLMRYVFVAAGWILPWLAGPLTPTLRGKAVAVGQLLGLSTALAPAVAAPTSAIVAAITLAALVWSFAVDVRRLWRQGAGILPSR